MEQNEEEIVTFEKVEKRLKTKPIEKWSDQDVFERYIVYGEDIELSDPEIQKLLIEHGYIEELVCFIQSVITDKEVIEKILESDFVKEQNIIVKTGTIRRIYFEEDENLPKDSDWMYVEFLGEDKSVITAKEFHSKLEPKECYGMLDNYTQLNQYKEDKLTIVIEKQDNQMQLRCALKTK